VNSFNYALGYSKVLDRWVPQSLTDYHNIVQEEVCSDLLSHYVADRARVSSRLVGGDETWTLQFIIQTNKYIIYIYINNILYIVRTPPCFDASASSAGSIILLLCQRIKLPEDDAGT